MSTENTVDMETVRETVASDFKHNMSGVMEPAKLDAAVTHLSRPTSSYPASGRITSLMLFLQVQITMSGSNHKQFNGKAAGLSFPGGGVLTGGVYTDDLARLYSETISFLLTITPVYFSVVFFDSQHNTLGSFQGEGNFPMSGVIGGAGTWGN